ncbi:MAG: TlpA disulfide reductase family protein [Bacteroidota bacterium]
MKHLLLGLALCSGMFSQAWAQRPADRERNMLMFEYVNSLHNLIKEGKIDTAVARSIILVEEYPSLLKGSLHDSRAQAFSPSLKASNHEFASRQIQYLHALSELNNPALDSFYFALASYTRFFQATDDEARIAEVEKLLPQIGPTPNHEALTERYGLMILKDLDRINFENRTLRDSLCQRLLNSLESRIPLAGTDRTRSEHRAQHRFWLAWLYYHLSSDPQLSLSEQDSLLSLAATYSPDAPDRQVRHAYFYHGVMLLDTPLVDFGFETKYIEFLQAQERFDEALSKLAELTLLEPERLNQLHELYQVMDRNASFEDYWQSQVNDFAADLPEAALLDLAGNPIDLDRYRGKWLYVDVWGTWCQPCVRELPDLQAFYQAQDSVADPVHVLTFSYRSEELEEFMQEHGYTFPVVEIDERVTKTLPISGYPTKLLITPTQKMIKIPFGVEWQSYVANYRGLPDIR